MNNTKCDVCGITGHHTCWNDNFYMYLCSKHYHQLRRHGKIIDSSPITVQDKNEIIIKDTHAEIILRNKKQEITGHALIDLDDVEKCKKCKWSIQGRGYVITYSMEPITGKKSISLHRYILDYNGDLDIDHINRNKLDNRKSNLRIVHRTTNASNKNSRGVYKDGKKWTARISRYCKDYYLGRYNTEEEALSARKKKEEELNKIDILLKEEYEKNLEQKVRGVSKTRSNTWRAYYIEKRKIYTIGTFKTQQEAINAREIYLKGKNKESA